MGCFLFHKWNSWEETDTPCKQKRVCSKCNEFETRIVHDFGEWEYKDAHTCIRVRSCRRCGKMEEGKEKHDMGEWSYASKDSCTQIKKCFHCGKREISYDKHQFSEWEYMDNISCIAIRYCKRCKLKDYGNMRHDWDEISLYTECMDKAIRIMSRKAAERKQKLSVIGNEMDVDKKLMISNEIAKIEYMEEDYKYKLENTDLESMGKVCRRCMQVINLGITKEDLENEIHRT